MERLRQSILRRPVAWTLAAAVAACALAAGALAATAPGGSAPAASAGAAAGPGAGASPPGPPSAGEPAPTGDVPPVPSEESVAAQEVAARAAAEAGQGVREGTVALRVPASGETEGYSLWGWVTADGVPGHMIVDPEGAPVAWTGCAPGPVRLVDRCGGAADAEGRLVLTGRAAAGEVESVRLVAPSGERLPAVVGDGGWMLVAHLPPGVAEEHVPDEVVARGVDGTVRRIPVAIAP